MFHGECFDSSRGFYLVGGGGLMATIWTGNKRFGGYGKIVLYTGAKKV